MCLALNKIFTLLHLWLENTVKKRTERMYEPKDGRDLRSSIRAWHNHNKLTATVGACTASNCTSANSQAWNLEELMGSHTTTAELLATLLEHAKKHWYMLQATQINLILYQKISGSQHRKNCKIPEHEKSRAVQAISHLGRGEEGRKGCGCYCVWCLG